MSVEYEMLDLPGIKVTSRRRGAKETELGYVDEVVWIEAETVNPTFARCCLDPDVVKNGVRFRLINDTPHGGCPVFINMKVQKGKCRHCGQTGMSEVLPHIQPNRHMTERLYRFICREGLLRSNTHSEVARHVHVSEGTARSIIHEFIDAEVADIQRVTPRVIGIDEKKLLGKFRAVLGNIEQKTVVNLIEDRDKSLARYLREMPDRHNVEVICIDQFAGYLRLAKTIFPGVPVVTDKFHVQRRANQALDKIRIRVSNSLRGDHNMRAARLKMSKTLFWTRAHKLDNEAAWTIREWGQRFPVLAHAYWTKERFFDMYEECKTPAQAELYYKRWVRTLPESCASEFKALSRIGPYWQPYVFAYFEHPYTTAYVESVNRALDEMQIAGRGYSFEIIRGKLMLSKPLEKRTFRDRHPNWMTAYSPDAPPSESAAWGIDIEKMIKALRSQSESLKLVDGRYVRTDLRKGLATIEATLAR